MGSLAKCQWRAFLTTLWLGPSHAVDFTQAFRSPWGARILTVSGAVRNSPFLWEVEPCKGNMNVPTFHTPGEAWRPSLNLS